jgi:hypothetical protein
MSLVRQRAEAWVGLCFLVAGFTTQAFVFFAANGNASIHGWREFVVGVAFMATPLAVFSGVYKWWVPRSVKRTWDQTWHLGDDGQPLEGEGLATAERHFGPNGDLKDL